MYKVFRMVWTRGRQVLLYQIASNPFLHPFYRFYTVLGLHKQTVNKAKTLSKHGPNSASNTMYLCQPVSTKWGFPPTMLCVSMQSTDPAVLWCAVVGIACTAVSTAVISKQRSSADAVATPPVAVSRELSCLPGCPTYPTA